MKTYRVKVNGKEYEVEIAEVSDETSMQTKQEPASSLSTPPGATETIVAPMPGNILELKVVPGQQVSKGKVLAILEAMKMENEIIAPVNGVVAKVYVTKGQSVESGSMLMEIS